MNNETYRLIGAAISAVGQKVREIGRDLEMIGEAIFNEYEPPEPDPSPVPVPTPTPDPVPVPTPGPSPVPDPPSPPHPGPKPTGRFPIGINVHQCNRLPSGTPTFSNFLQHGDWEFKDGKWSALLHCYAWNDEYKTGVKTVGNEFVLTQPDGVTCTIRPTYEDANGGWHYTSTQTIVGRGRVVIPHTLAWFNFHTGAELNANDFNLHSTAQTNLSDYYAPVINDLSSFSVLRSLNFQMLNSSRHETTVDMIDPLSLSQGGAKLYPGTSERQLHGGALEHFLLFCNEAGCIPWVGIPHLANDAYRRRFAEICYDLAPVIMDEESNEFWNRHYKFQQHFYAAERGKSLPDANHYGGRDYDYAEIWNAHRSAENWEIFKDVYGSEFDSRVKRVFAWQAADSGAASTGLQYMRDHDLMLPTHVAFAPYMHLAKADYSTDQDRMLESLHTNALPEVRKWMERYKARADEYGIEAAAYEFGQHVQMAAVDLKQLDDVEKAEYAAVVKATHDLQRNPGMGELYDAYHDLWYSIMGDSLACHFTYVGYNPDRTGTFGIKHQFKDDASPKWHAIMGELGVTS